MSLLMSQPQPICEVLNWSWL